MKKKIFSSGQQFNFFTNDIFKSHSAVVFAFTSIFSLVKKTISFSVGFFWNLFFCMQVNFLVHKSSGVCCFLNKINYRFDVNKVNVFQH